MAGDWIKMRSDLLTHPKVVRISSALKADKLRVIGGLHAVWSLFDAHSIDGTLDGYTIEILDEYIGWPGFSAEMVKICWLEESAESLTTPRFDEHNGQSAKRRATETKRKRMARTSAEMSASDADKKRSREEKRREELKEPHTPQAGRKADSAIGLPAYIDKCRSEGKKPIDENHPVFAYASKINLSHEFLRLHWCEFKYRYSLPNAKRYKAWQTVFDKSVRGNWFKLWFEAENGYALTTVGKQAKLANREAA